MQTSSATISNLPAAVASYFTHATTDPEALARCFSEDALVIDERQEHRGRAAIAAWNASVTEKLSFTTEVLGVEEDSAHTTVRARVAGTFPGSPIELRFRFTLKDDLIARLEIGP